MANIERYLLNLAGEYRVCSELNKRGIFATITYGHRKGVDVYAIGDRHRPAVRIEVKTSQKNNFVTNIAKKGLVDSDSAPDYWVFCQMKRKDDDTFVERFFVLSHVEVCEAQKRRNDLCAERYMARHGSLPTVAPGASAGVDNVLLVDIEKYEDRWSKILGSMTAGRS